MQWKKFIRMNFAKIEIRCVFSGLKVGYTGNWKNKKWCGIKRNENFSLPNTHDIYHTYQKHRPGIFLFFMDFSLSTLDTALHSKHTYMLTHIQTHEHRIITSYRYENDMFSILLSYSKIADRRTKRILFWNLFRLRRTHVSCSIHRNYVIVWIINRR